MKSIKWQHYDQIYPKHFPSNPKTILEIGIREGGSLVRWHQEFPEASVVGLDIQLPRWQVFPPGISAHLGSQSNPDCLQHLMAIYDGFDIIIDDGSHRPYDQIASFKTLWPHVREGGCYIVEDMHMQGKLRWKIHNLFWPNIYQTAIRMARAQDKPIHDTQIATRDYSIHFYPHCVVFQKKKTVMQSVERDYRINP